MSDNYVEKSFLYLTSLSVLLHLAIFGLVVLIPPEKVKSPPEPTMVDLTELPMPPPPPPAPKPSVKRVPESPTREAKVSRAIPPKGKNREIELPRQQPTTGRPNQAVTRPEPPPPATAKQQPSGIPLEQGGKAPIARGEGIFRPKTGESPDPSRLFPSAGKLARLEDNYRNKYRQEVEDGETNFINTDDIQFGSFHRRLETAIYGVWHYPEEAAQRGIEGVTLVKMTFNRSGEIVHVEQLESSGSGILDQEVFRALKQLGPIGSFPKAYPRNTYNLIAFFHYGSGRSRLR